VNLGVVFGLASRDTTGKILGLWVPVVLFVIMGMEHSIANQFFVNIGLMYGADTTIARMFYNQSAVVPGNLIGGAIVVGLSEHLMNHWKSPLPWHAGHPRGSLAGHDVESTRKAREPAGDTPSHSNANSMMLTSNAEKDHGLQLPTSYRTNASQTVR